MAAVSSDSPMPKSPLVNPCDQVLRHMLSRGTAGQASSSDGRTSFLPVIELIQEHGHPVANTSIPSHLPQRFSRREPYLNMPGVFKTSVTGTTVLHWLSQRGKAEYVGLALARGANPNSCDEAGRTPILAAASCCAVGAMRHLIAYGARVEVADQRGYTSLLFACLRGRADCVRILLERAGETLSEREMQTFLNARLPSGIGALAATARTGSVEVLQLLFEYGAHEAVSYSGESCYEIARKHGNQAVAELLLQHAALRPTVGLRHAQLLHREVVPGGVDEYGEIQPPVQL